jgi:hypothetical protein
MAYDESTTEYHHLVEMPAIARPRTAQPQPWSNHRAEFQHPATDALVGEVEPALCKQFLDITIAQGEAQVEPNRMLNHGRRETVPRYEIGNISQPTAGRRPWPSCPDNAARSFPGGYQTSVR